jgi:hypothetical protein
MSRKWFACALVELDRVVEKKLRETARAEPGEAALVTYAPECESPVSNKSVPPENR